MNYLKQHQRNIKALYIKSPNFIPTKSILERRTSGNLKFFPSIKHVRDVYERVLNQTGKSITVHQMKYANSWNNTEKIGSNVKY